MRLATPWITVLAAYSGVSWPMNGASATTTRSAAAPERRRRRPSALSLSPGV